MLDENYAAKKYYKYDEYGKEVEKGATGFKNDNTFIGAVSEGGNLYKTILRIMNYFLLSHMRYAQKLTQKGWYRLSSLNN